MTKEILRKYFREDGKTGSPKLPTNLKNFIIDIDGVICKDIPNEEPERMVNAEEMPGAKEQINKWFNEGHIITFFTSRTENLREITIEWLKEHKFKYNSIIFNKPRGGNYHYIDDKHVRATTFNGKFGDFVYRKKKVQVFK